MPDAISKTVPIWTTVLNRLMFPEEFSFHDLKTPSDVVSSSEHAQIEARLEELVCAVQALDLDLPSLRKKLKNKPMCITWQRPGDDIPSSPSSETNLIVLCTASNQTSNDFSTCSSYVQGAADDPESWSLGLDAATFWSHNESLLAASEDELPGLIERLLSETRLITSAQTMTLIKPTSNLWVGSATADMLLGRTEFGIVISLTSTPLPIQSVETPGKRPRALNLVCASGKVGSRQLRHELPKLLQLQGLVSTATKVVVACETGKDLSVGVALAILCLFCSDKGEMQAEARSEGMNKDFIKKRLSWIMVSMPDAAPSRATLQSVNAFLMG